jgi:hypothetical protein
MVGIMGRRQTNIGPEQLRWSLDAAERETGTSKKTFQTRLRDAEIQPGADGLFSTKQILLGITGSDIRQERLREVKARATNMELRNAEREKLLLPASSVRHVLEQTFLVMQAELLGSDLPIDLRNSLMSHLKDIDVEAIGPPN